MKTRVSYASAAFLALAISACSQSNIASAEPPGFPDLNGFSEAPAASYTMGWDRGSKTIGFSTANGVDCNFGAPKNPNGDNQEISCWGPLPGLQDVPVHGGDSGPCDFGTVNQRGIAHTKGACKDASPGRKILNPGQKVSYGNVTCAAGDDGLIACIERVSPERGFVLQPSGSFVF